MIWYNYHIAIDRCYALYLSFVWYGVYISFGFDPAHYLSFCNKVCLITFAGYHTIIYVYNNISLSFFKVTICSLAKSSIYIIYHKYLCICNVYSGNHNQPALTLLGQLQQSLSPKLSNSRCFSISLFHR